MSLPAAPPSAVDDRGAPRFGTYQGALAQVDLSRLSGSYALGLPQRLVRHKTWQYLQVATPEVLAVFAIADITYTANAFCAVLDLTQQRMVFDQGWLGLPGLASVNGPPVDGLRARFRVPGVAMRCACGEAGASGHYRVDIEVSALPLLRPGLEWQGEVVSEDGPPALTVIAPIENDGVNITQKWCGLLASGHIVADGRRYELDGGVVGLDYTQGYLARHTAWRWAMANGRLDDGTVVGFNLVEGFNESASANENALWVGRRLVPLGRAHFTFDKRDVLEPWRIITDDGVLDLAFRPLAAHREDRDYKLVRSHFAQPLGWFEGTLKLPDRTLTVHRLAGVTEDQDILW